MTVELKDEVKSADLNKVDSGLRLQLLQVRGLYEANADDVKAAITQKHVTDLRSQIRAIQRLLDSVVAIGGIEITSLQQGLDAVVTAAGGASTMGASVSARTTAFQQVAMESIASVTGPIIIRGGVQRRLVAVAGDKEVFDIQSAPAEAVPPTVLLEKASGPKPSGVKTNFSAPYQLCLGAAPAGYTLVKGNETFSLTGDRSCNAGPLANGSQGQTQTFALSSPCKSRSHLSGVL